MKPVHILHIGDMQNGFTREDGNLYVPGAQEIIDRANNFLWQVQIGVFDHIVIVLDTHFTEEYYQTEEGKLFPLHCEFGTRDWELSIDVSGLSNTCYVMKNQFNLWGEKEVIDISFTSLQRKNAYNLLFRMTDDLYNPSRTIPRDEFISAIRADHNTTDIDVTMIGVASDYCIRYAMEGWLARGARVTILHDLTKGIEKEIPQVLDEYRHTYGKSGMVRLLASMEFIKELTNS